MKRFDEAVITDGSKLDTVGKTSKYLSNRCKEFAAYVKFSKDTLSGQVLIETAIDDDDTGTWAIVGTINWIAANRTHHLAVTGLYRAIRARISSPIVGGTVDVHFMGVE